MKSVTCINFFNFFFSSLAFISHSDFLKLPNDFNLSNKDQESSLIYAQLVWDHFHKAVQTGQKQIATQLMLNFPFHMDDRKFVFILSSSNIIDFLKTSDLNLLHVYLEHFCEHFPSNVSFS